MSSRTLHYQKLLFPIAVLVFGMIKQKVRETGYQIKTLYFHFDCWIPVYDTVSVFGAIGLTYRAFVTFDPPPLLLHPVSSTWIALLLCRRWYEQLVGIIFTEKCTIYYHNYHKVSLCKYLIEKIEALSLECRSC